MWGEKTIVFLFTLSIWWFFFSSFEDIDGEIDDLIAYFEQELTLDSSFPEICSPELDMTQVHISGQHRFLFKPTHEPHPHHLGGSIVEHWLCIVLNVCSSAEGNPDVHISLGCVQWSGPPSSGAAVFGLPWVLHLCTVSSSTSTVQMCESASLLCAHLVILGSYISRDPEIWHSACARVWGRNCTKVVPFKSWRDMFLRRPRVRFDGKSKKGMCEYRHHTSMAGDIFGFCSTALFRVLMLIVSGL